MTARAAINHVQVLNWIGELLPWWGWLILFYLAYFIWVYYHPKLWIKLDTGEIDTDGAGQSLGFVFHRQRATWRGLGIAIPALVAVSPLWLHFHRFWPGALAWLGLCSLHGGYWMWYFNPQLSIARNKDYIEKYHVSWAVNASWLDRYIWAEAWNNVYNTPVVPGERDLKVIVEAARIYEKRLNDILYAGTSFFIFLHIFSYVLTK